MLADTALCVSVALLPAASLIVPLFSARALAPMLIPSASLSPAWIVYWNTSEVPPLPDPYVAVRFVPPTFRVSCGPPVVVTFSLKVALTETTSPALSRLFCTPEALLIDTPLTLGATPSTTKALFAPNELLPPGLAKVNVALFPSASLIVPLFNAKAVVLT